MADTPDQQRKHANKLQAERAVMDMTGMSRSQVRAMEKLNDFAQRRLAATEQQAPAKKADDTVKVTSKQFEPTSSSVTANQPGSPGGGAGDSSTTEDYYVAINGTLYTQSFKVSGAPTAV